MRLTYPIIVAFVLLLQSCGRSGPETSGEQVFEVKGIVQSVKEDRSGAIIHHEAIPDYMAEMVMALDVKDAAELDGINVGDAIRFRMHATDEGHWISDVVRTATDQKVIEPEVPAVEVDTSVFVGKTLPNVPLTSQDGETRGLLDFRGKAVALTFIFTRCSLPDYCPLMSSNFRALQTKLAEQERLAGKWQLVSVSFDPAFDTPAVLGQYASRLSADPEAWSFMVGDEESTSRLAKSVGLRYQAQEDPSVISHNLRTLILGPDGRIARLWVGNEWTSDELVEVMEQVLREKETGG